MSTPATRSANFSSQCFPAFPPSFFNTYSQYENERDLSLASIYSSAPRVNISVDMVPSFLFMNIHYRLTSPEKLIEIFEGSTDNIQDQIYMIWVAVLTAPKKLTLRTIKKINNTQKTQYSFNYFSFKKLRKNM